MARLSETTPTVSNYANISHKKGDVGLITINKDTARTWIAAGSSLSAVFFSLMAGTAITLIVSLKSGAIAEDSKGIFWLAFWGSLVLSIFFGVTMVKQEWEKRRIRRWLDELPSTELKE
jgi:hypothetical protein